MLETLTSSWSRPYKIVRVLQALGMDVPQRLRRERLALLLDALARASVEATLADGTPIDPDESPGIEAKIRLRLAPGRVVPRSEFGYEVVDVIPTGGMAQCFKVRDADGRFRFLKKVPVAGLQADALRRELEIYQKLEHAQASHVLRIVEHHQAADSLALVAEFADGGTLEEHRENEAHLTPPAVRVIGLEVLAGLRELHSLGIVHRDLKPANVLRSDGAWKLADFGIAKNLVRLSAKGRTFQQFGTLGYAPPEQWAGREAHPTADVYAFGKLLVFLLTGSTDIDHLHDQPAWATLVRECVRFEPESRISVDQAADRLRAL